MTYHCLYCGGDHDIMQGCSRINTRTNPLGTTPGGSGGSLGKYFVGRPDPGSGGLGYGRSSVTAGDALTQAQMLFQRAKGYRGDEREVEEFMKLKEMMNQSGVRTFSSGANRSDDTGKIDPEGFMDPMVIERYCQYMAKNRTLPDGSTRASDNWQLGIPQDQLLKSAWRHFFDLWKYGRGYKTVEEVEDSACALVFNVFAWLRGHLKARGYLEPEKEAK